MKKLILQGFEVMTIGKNTPDDFENFHEEVYVFIGQEGKDKIYSDLFKLNIISYKNIEEFEKESDEEGVYLKYTLIMKYYDEKILKKHIQQILDKCNLQSPEKRFNCLSLYLRSEIEEDVYY